MKRAAVPLLALLLALPAGAQLRGVPVLSPGRQNPSARLVLHALAARAPEQSEGRGGSAVLQAHWLAAPRVTLNGALAATSMADAGTRPQLLAGAAITVLHSAPARIMPNVAIAGSGATTLGGDHRERAAALALPVDVIVDLHGLFVEPFLAPRVQTRRVDRGDAVVSQNGRGISYGARFGLAIGAALTFAVDHSRYHEARHSVFTRDRGTSTSVALGLRLALRTHAP